MAETHGRCSHCDIIWRWRSTKHTPRVTKGEAFCEVCGCELSRTAARLAKHVLVRVGIPIGPARAAGLRAIRVIEAPRPKAGVARADVLRVGPDGSKLVMAYRPNELVAA